jgi:putative permease
LLLGSLVGLSVVIPYVGAVLVTIPVIIVGYLQWGLTGGFTGDFCVNVLWIFTCTIFR